MPRIPSSGVITAATLSSTFTDAYGRTRSTSFELPAAATGAQITAIHNAMGDLSNAAQSEIRQGARLKVNNVSDLVTFDELFDIGASLVMVYSSTLTGRLQYLEVPSPDASIMNSNGSIDLANAQIQALDTAVVAANANLALQRAYIATRKVQKIVTTPLLAPPVEPVSPQLPPPDPAN